MIGDKSSTRRPLRHLRWWIAALLFASTVINYIDRQTLSLLAPYLKQDYHWTNTDYAMLVIAFRVAYTIGQTLFGRLMDRIGTRRGLTLSVLWYSLVSVFTPLARGLYSFASFRFLLGAGESANWPGATKAVSEWFPKRERGLATALFDSGSSVGAAIAPFLVLTAYFRWGWRPAFILPGLLGFLWLIVWRRAYHTPQQHSRISEAERQMILADIYDPGVKTNGPKPGWAALLTLPQTWGTIVAKALTDPVWFFVTDWFSIYLVAKGLPLKKLALWVPFISSDLGNFFGGAASDYLIKRGWSLGAARKALVVFGGFGVLLLIPTVLTFNLWAIVLLFSLATFSYAAFSTIANVLPADLFFSESVASVSGMSGTAAGIGTIIASGLIGYSSDARQAAAAHSFDPIVIVAGMVPFVAMILVLALVRNTRATEQGLVRRI
ncbi:MAG: MFS transporter [Acidobacteria bacterium Pan2503]|uniref:MFS transporter n=1 Tax=Candidatus Acidiferrum panamense TaxID=2741543 RepID=A0A7V8SY22_9BACT|nr:MFS transporter [Candidatus Acidoferrum panamensis]